MNQKAAANNGNQNQGHQGQIYNEGGNNYSEKAQMKKDSISAQTKEKVDAAKSYIESKKATSYFFIIFPFQHYN